MTRVVEVECGLDACYGVYGVAFLQNKRDTQATMLPGVVLTTYYLSIQGGSGLKKRKKQAGGCVLCFLVV